jgi:S1-C subfamily serine protease
MLLKSVLASSLLALTFLAGTPHPVLANDAAPADVAKLNEKVGPAIVTVKFILKGEQDIESEALGVMVDGSGLVLLANEAFQGPFGPFGPAQSPSELKVLVGDDNTGVDAKVFARDSELGLAWVKIDTAPEKPYATVEFAADAKPVLGDSIYCVTLMGKFFDRAPSVHEARINAITKKPRTLLIPSIGFAGTEQGLPVFDSQGRAVGVTTFIFPEQDELRGTPGGPQVLLRGTFRVMVLPSVDVIDATKRAKETGGKVEEPATEQPAGKPAEGSAEKVEDAKSKDKNE